MYGFLVSDILDLVPWDPHHGLDNDMTPRLAKTEQLYIQLRAGRHLISVGVWLEWAFTLHTDVIRLLFAQFRQVRTQSWNVECSHLLIQSFGQKVNIVLICLGLLPILDEIKLGQDLIGEGAGHHK